MSKIKIENLEVSSSKMQDLEEKEVKKIRGGGGDSTTLEVQGGGITHHCQIFPNSLICKIIKWK